MNFIANRHCRWLTGTVTTLMVATPTAVYTGLATQTQKWGTNLIWDKGIETVSCVTQKDNASNKLFKELEQRTALVWSNINYDVKTNMLTRVPVLNISAKEPGKNLEIINEWIKEAAACNLMKFECNKERVQCNQDLPAALAKASDSKDETLKAKDAAKAQIDPLLERKGECKGLEALQKEVIELREIKIKYEILKAQTEQKSIFTW